MMCRLAIQKKNTRNVVQVYAEQIQSLKECTNHQSNATNLLLIDFKINVVNELLPNQECVSIEEAATNR